jgi:hypothetical protein
MSKGSATFVRTLPHNGIAEEQHLWAVPEYDYRIGETTTFILTSRALVPHIYGNGTRDGEVRMTQEIMGFAADSSGEVLDDWALFGGYTTQTHEEVLREAGYEVVEQQPTLF